MIDIPEDAMRRAVEAVAKALGSMGYGAAAERAVQAAIDSLTSDVCPTCGGRATDGAYNQRPCPDCVNGKVTPTLISMVWAGRLIERAQQNTRAEVLAEVKEWLREWEHSEPDYTDNDCVSFIERQEREAE